MSRIIFALPGALLGLFLLPASATAGLIEWSYTSPGGTAYVETDLMPPGGGHGLLSLVGAPLTGKVGSAVVPVITGTSFAVVEQGNGDFFVNDSTGLSVTITDKASGAVGFFSWDVSVTGSPGFVDITPRDTSAQIATIGGNRYAVTLGNDRNAKVDVSPVPTPEPTTIGLAAVGVVFIGLVRRRSTRAAQTLC